MCIADRTVFEASIDAARRDVSAVLALVLETEGSTYVRRGAAALFGATGGQVGWLSGGCLEAEIALRAAAAAQYGRIEWMQVDTREDEDLFAGSALGCRGRLHLALLPLRALRGWEDPIGAWLAHGARLQLQLDAEGSLRCAAGDMSMQAALPVAGHDAPAGGQWTFDYAALPRVAMFGAGPESALLLPLLRTLGWYTLVVETRERWQVAAAAADRVLALTPRLALAQAGIRGAAAALVMHHNFELDRETLQGLAESRIPYLGLLGPLRRREDLFKLLTPAQHDALLPRLHSPVGLKLGGQGAEAIALSIAAQLQEFRHRA